MMEGRIKLNVNLILEELSRAASSTDFSNSHEFLLKIVESNKIVTVGAGRVGIAMRAFAKRLKHLGKDAYFITDEVLPRFGKNDLMIIGSGSGETASILTLAKKSKEAGSNLLLITTQPNSSIALLADHVIVLELQKDNLSNSVTPSRQPMTTLFEQFLFLTLDAAVLNLMEMLSINESQMKELHNVFE